MFRYLFAAAGCALFFAAAQPAPAKADVLVSAINAGLCVDANTSNYTVVLYGCHGGANQNFFTTAYGQQRMTFNNVTTCLDTANPRNGLFPGTLAIDIVMRPCNPNAPSQRWNLDTRTGQFNNEQGYCFDIPFNSAYQGQKVQGHSCNQRNNQKWARGAFVRGSGPAASARTGTIVAGGGPVGISGGRDTQGGGGRLIGMDGATMVAAGAGNMIRGSGGMVAAGAGN